MNVQNRLWGPWKKVKLQKQGNLVYIKVSWREEDTGKEEVLTDYSAILISIA